MNEDTLKHPEAVLKPEFLLLENSLIEVYACKITRKKCRSYYYKLLNKVLPLPSELRHLKRIKDDSIILTSVTLWTKECLSELKTKMICNELLLDDAYLVWVSTGPLLTYGQWENASQHWPCHFHADEQLERLLGRRYFVDNEVALHYKWMHRLAYIADKHNAATAVVVDPVADLIIGLGYDKSEINPCCHAVTAAIAMTCEVQHRAVCLLKNAPIVGSWPEPYLGVKLDLDEELNSLLSEFVKFSTNYIGTGCDIYLSREPCLMCAMALIHFRIRYVFYDKPSTCGALGTKYMLHMNPLTNHRFKVFRLHPHV